MQRKPELSVEILNVIVHYEETCPEKMEISRPIPFFNIFLLQFVSPFHPNKGHFNSKISVILYSLILFISDENSNGTAVYFGAS